MGINIARAHLQAGNAVQLYDVSAAALNKASERLTASDCAASGCSADPVGSVHLSEGRAAAQLDCCTDLTQLADCDLLIESVVEQRAVKQQVLRKLESCCAENALLTTNTSTIPLSELGSELEDPSRLCGLHFCNPVSDRRLVEVVQPQPSSTWVIRSAIAHVRRLGKLPIVVQDRPGFVVNRVLMPFLNEALQLVCEGVEPTAIDNAAEQFGFALGPLAVFDMIGIDTALLAGRKLWEAYPQRTLLTPVLPALAKRGLLGRKTGSGFFRYSNNGNSPRFDPAVRDLLTPYVRRPKTMTDQQLIYRLLLPMLLEATRIIEEGAAKRVEDVDTAVLFGLAFPETRGGLFFWADTLDLDSLLERLQPLQQLGERMHPTRLLADRAAAERSFYV